MKISRPVEINGEDDVKREIKKLLKTWGWWNFMPSASQFGKSGIPDFVACKFGLFLGIEAKFGYNKPTDIQDERMKEIRAAGGIAIWINEKRLDKLELLLAILDKKFNKAKR